MKPFKLVLITFTICILSSFLTFCITNSILTNKPSEPVHNKEKAEDLYSSLLTLSQIYNKCHHTITEQLSDPITYSSSEELRNRFPGYQITSGEGDFIVLSTEIANFCPYHYKATLSDNQITITRLYDDNVISSFKILTHALDSNEKHLLEQGITLNSQKALSSFIEDFTS